MTTTDSAPTPIAARSGIAAVVAALRVPQWIKNLLVLVPVVLDHRLHDPDILLRGVLAAVAFCAAASAGYIFNDVRDRDADRRHPFKRRRPFAAGELSATTGAVLILALLAIALVLGLSLPRDFLWLLLLYLVTTSVYSFRFKQIPVLDVLILAGLYTLRVLAGIAATGVRFSTWLLAFAMFIFLSLAFLKRYAELYRLRGESAERAAGRGYVVADLEWLGSMGAAAGYLSVLVLALYITSEQVLVLYAHPSRLWLICPLLLYWISRLWFLAHRGRIHEDPLVAAMGDPVSYILGVLVAVVLAVAL
ncbi:MAG TPA: UbiA family prenyltransferase [Gemmatimonadales bacterium]|nr:UbiA family prenyltransferase [Gemmatimonadales bacterium]